VQKGGEFLAIIRIGTTSEAEFRSIRQSVNASFYSSGSVDVVKTESFQKEIAKYNRSIEIFRTGIDDELPNPGDIGKVVDYALKFPSKVGGRALVFLTKPYSDILATPSEALLEIGSAEAIIVSLSRQYNIALQRYNDLIYTINNANLFDDPNLTSLRNQLSKMADTVNRIRGRAAECQKAPHDPKVCKFVDEEFVPADTVLPSRKMIREEPKRICELKDSEACRVPENIVGYRRLSKHPTCRFEGNSEFKANAREYLDPPINVIGFRYKFHAARNFPGQEVQKFREGYPTQWKEFIGMCDAQRENLISTQYRPETYELRTVEPPYVFRYLSGFGFEAEWECPLRFMKYRFALAENPGCGPAIGVEDLNQPIYSKCRHVSHGPPGCVSN
jgi:hypothetical protein